MTTPAQTALLVLVVPIGACARSAEPARPQPPAMPTRAALGADEPNGLEARSRAGSDVEARQHLASTEGDAGRSKPSGEARASLAPGSPAAFAAAVSSARSKIEEMARAESADTTDLAAEALRALADAIEAAPDRPERIGELLAELRFQAERLGRADPLSFDLTRWMRAGLAATLDALQALPRARARHMKPWLAAARSATDAIDADDFLSFQRPAVQDAFRAVVDGFAAAAQDCESEVASERERARRPSE